MSDTRPFPLGLDPFGLYLPHIAGPCLVESQDVLSAIVEAVPQDGNFLEVGTWTGSTASHVADRRPQAQVIAIDTFPDALNRLLLFAVNRRSRPNLRLWWGSFEDFAKGWTKGYFDAIFVDACHEQKSCQMDLVLSTTLLAPGGALLAHDYQAPLHTGVTNAVEWFCDHHGWRVKRTVSTLALLEREK